MYGWGGDAIGTLLYKDLWGAVLAGALLAEQVPQRSIKLPNVAGCSVLAKVQPMLTCMQSQSPQIPGTAVCRQTLLFHAAVPQLLRQGVKQS
jgi:hypothetical protein